MRNFFVPNGTTSLEIIYKLAKEEFGDEIKESNNYLSIKMDVIKVLRKMESNELEEIRLDTIVGLEHLSQNDFGNFISIRFVYWTLICTIATMIIGDVPIYEYFNIGKRAFGYIVMILLTVLLVITARTIHIQHDQIEYLRFRLMCINELCESIERRENKFPNKKRK